MKAAPRNKRECRFRWNAIHGAMIASGLCASQLFAVSAFAQTAAADADNGGKLDEVTVTARKVSERALDVPLVITTLSGQVLEDSHATSLVDIVRLSPGVTVRSTSAENGVNITIRGLADLSGGAADPNVAVFIDGVYQQNRSAISLGLLDLQRVEIIKGPVSALYGRNAYAGVINYVTTPPPDYVEASVKATYGDYGLRGGKLTLGGPLGSPAVLGRLIYNHEEFGGTYRDAVNGSHAGGYRKDDALGTLTIKPLDRLTIYGSFYYGDDKFKSLPIAYINNNCGPRSASPASPGAFTQLCGEIDYRNNPVEVAQLPSEAGQSGNKRRVQANSLKFSYDLNFADASALFGYNKVTEIGYADFTAHRDGIPFVATNGRTYNLQELFGSNNNNEDGSVDLRLASKQDQPLRGAVGLYVFRGRSTTTTLIGINGSSLPPGVLPLPQFGVQFYTPTGTYSTSNYTLVNQTDRIVSPFANADYDILPNLTASVEGRHTAQKKTQDIVRNAFATNIDHPFGAAGTVGSDVGYNNYRTGVRYKITPDSMVYGTVADGTKSGGFNQRATIPSEIAFAPETNTTFEIGAKASLLDRTLVAGVSLFHVNSRDVQITGPSDDPRNVGLVTKNYASLKSSGVDFDLAWAPVRGLTLNTGVELVSPKLGKNTYDFSNAAGCALIASCASRVVLVQTPQGPRAAVNLDGLQAPNSSKATVNFGAQYNGAINEQWRYFTRADFRYESKQYTAPVQYNYFSSRKTIDLNAGLFYERYKFTAFVRNLTNDQTPNQVTPNTLLNGGATPYVAYLPQKRVVGVTAQVDY